MYAGPNLERATLRAYAILWNGHALPRLGAIPLRELTPQTIAHFRADLEQAIVAPATPSKLLSPAAPVVRRPVTAGRLRLTPDMGCSRDGRAA